MKQHPKTIGEKVELLGLYREVSPEQMEAARDQALKVLESSTGQQTDSETSVFQPVRSTRKWQWPAVATIAAAIALAVLLPNQVVQSAPAVLEDAAGQRQIQYGELVRPTGDMSAMLSLTDGPRVETRSMSEFMLERMDDGGTRIRLNTGGLIVDAASQRHANLYVQTKDITALVSGAVSLVKAEEGGSRVAAIGGEVRVQQGSNETKLRSGEQVASNPKMEPIPVKEELAWSRQAEVHAAMLAQAPAPARQESSPSRLVFEVSSVRPSAPAPPPAPGARGATGTNSGPTIGGCTPGSSGYSQQVDPRRIAITRATLFQLIVWAYPIQGEGLPNLRPFALCDVVSTTPDLISGGPAWLKTEMWDVQASIPEGVFTGKVDPLDPKLQQMLQALLVERFRLVIRRVTKETPVYLLKVGKSGPKFNGHGETYAIVLSQTFVSAIRGGAPVPATELPPPPNGSFQMIPRRLNPGVFSQTIEASNVSMESWAKNLYNPPGQLDRPVLDRTGLTGRFDFHYESDTVVPLGGQGPPEDLQKGLAGIKREAVKAIGFELEESRMPYDVWVIERAEKASEN